MENKTCPACGVNPLHEEEVMNSLSRYCKAYICSECGMSEAFNGFFWEENAIEQGRVSKHITQL